jgi:hypothetical protein
MVWFGVVPQGVLLSLSFSLFGDFGAFSWGFEAVLGELVGDVCVNPSWFFSF